MAIQSKFYVYTRESTDGRALRESAEGRALRGGETGALPVPACPDPADCRLKRGDPGKLCCCPVARRTPLSWFLGSNLTSPGSGATRSAADCSHTAPTKLSPPALALGDSTSSAYTARRPFRLVMRVSLMPNKSARAPSVSTARRQAFQFGATHPERRWRREP